MADFLDEEAEESSEEEQQLKHSGRAKRARIVQESDSEEDEEDEGRLREELKDLINDNSESEGEENASGDSDNNSGKRKRRKSQSPEFDDRLEDDDYDLLEENLGISVKRASRFKRLRRVQDNDSDDEEEPEKERDTIANELFDESGVEDEVRSIASHRREPDTFTEAGSEGEVSDADDFIVDDDGRPIADKRRKKRPIYTDTALQEAQDIFGIDFDYEEFENRDGDGDDDGPGEEEEDEDEDNYVDDDVNGEREAARRRKRAPKKKKGTRKTIFEIYEPSELKSGHFTDIDNEIRNTDKPERMQLRSVPVKPVAEDSDELSLEAQWIYRYAFCIPPITIQDAHLSEEAKERARKGPQTVGKIKIALDFMRNHNFEVPFISFYRKEYVNPELNINDLWKVYRYDAKWCVLNERKESLVKLFEKLRNYQLDEIMKRPDDPLPEWIRVINEEDIDRLKAVETSEELNDVHHHFMLYYSRELADMQGELRQREREANLAARLEKRRLAALEGSADNELEIIQDELDPEESEETLKQAVRNGPYELCRRARLDGFAKKFGLTPFQYAENLRDNYQRHEIDQEAVDPASVASEYRGKKFQSTKDVIEAGKLMVAYQLAREPLIRKCVRDVYMERTKMSVKPTKRGIKEIDEGHNLWTMKYLKDKPVRELEGDQWLKLSMAEADKLIEIDFSASVEGTTSADLLEEMKQLYHRDEFSKNVQEWNELRAKTVEMAYNQMLIPDMKKELRLRLTAEAKESVLRSCCRKMYNWIKVAPFVCNFDEETAAAAPEEEEERWDDEEKTTEKKNWSEVDGDWKTEGGLRVMGIGYVPDWTQAAFACLIAANGECIDHRRLPNLLRRKNSPKEDDKAMKEADLAEIRSFLEAKKPHVVVIGGESREAVMIAEDVREVISGLVGEGNFPPIKVEICENELAKIYANGTRGNHEFPEFPIVLRQAISVARRIQDPLIEFSQLCGPDDEILCLMFHPLQNQIPKDDLLENIQVEFVNRVNEVGVDFNAALQRDNSHLVQFVCGLGVRKAHALLKILKQTNKRIENRTQLVTVCHMGPKVFINCAGFVKIDTSSLGEGTEAYIEVLDGTRVHPETYEWARKMAVDALEYDDDEDANPAGALEEIFKVPDRLKDLDLDAFAEELERQGFGDKSMTLYDIRAELQCRYKDLRLPYESPSPEKIFNILTHETPETFYIGKLTLATVTSINRKRPEGEQLDQANPTRNDQSGLWQCPFCLGNDFPELSEVWNHFDAGTCPGKPIGVRLRFDNGISGYVNMRNLSDKRVNNPEDRVRSGQVVNCRITKIDVERFSVECTTKTSDLADQNNEWRPQRDVYYDIDAEEAELRAEEESKKIKLRQTYVKRVIVHSSFHNIDYAEAAKLLETMKQGESIVRPSSKGCDHLTVTWKVTDEILHHIDVREENKKFAFSLGEKLFIGAEEFEDLDEIIARYVNPMAGYAAELLDSRYYRPNVDGIEEKANEVLKAEKQENPGRIPSIVSASKKYPGKFLLSYLPRERCVHEYISLSPDGMRYRDQIFNRVSDLLIWFKANFRQPRPQPQPKIVPEFCPPTPTFNNDGYQDNDDDDTDSLDHHTLSMTSDTPYTSSTPGGSRKIAYTPSAKTPHLTPFAKSPYSGNSNAGQNDSEFAYPGPPISYQKSYLSQNTPARSDAGSDFTDWKRAPSNSTNNSSNNDYGSNTRGRGGWGGGRGQNERGGYRGRGNRGNRGGYGDRGGRGGRGRQGNGDVLSRPGNNTPLWDENESWDDSAQNTGNQSNAFGNRSNNNSTKSSNNVGNGTPLWDEGESWDDDSAPIARIATNPPVASKKPAAKQSALWDESESWDDDSAPIARIATNAPAAIKKPAAKQSALWDESESWDDDSAPIARIATNAPAASKKPAANQSALWDESESWDEPGDSIQAPKATNNNRESMSGGRFSAAPSPSTSWGGSESGDNPDPRTAARNSQCPSRGTSIASSRAGSATRSIGSRTPLYAPEESWDDEGPSGPAEPKIPSQNYVAPIPANPQSSFGASFGNQAPYRQQNNNRPQNNSYTQNNNRPQNNNYTQKNNYTQNNNRPQNNNYTQNNNRPQNNYTQNNNRRQNNNYTENNNRPQNNYTQNNNRPQNNNYTQNNNRPQNNSYTQNNNRRGGGRIPLRSNNVPRSQGPPSSAGSRTPLYQQEESWDDDVSTPVASIASRPPTGPISIPRTSSNAGSVGSRTPLYQPEESWDDGDSVPAPAIANQPRTASISDPRTSSIAGSVGSRTPLYQPEESWDDGDSVPVPAIANRPRTASISDPRTSSIAGSVGSRTPLYQPEDSWDDADSAPVPAVANRPRTASIFDPQTPIVPGSLGSRTARQEDNGESASVPSIGNRSRAGSISDPRTSSIAGSTGSRTPLYQPEESWDDEAPETAKSTNDSYRPGNSTGRPTGNDSYRSGNSNGRPTGNNFNRRGNFNGRPAGNDSYRPGNSTGCPTGNNSYRPGNSTGRPTGNDSYRAGNSTGRPPFKDSNRPGNFTGRPPFKDSYRPGNSTGRPPFKDSNRPGNSGGRPPFNDSYQNRNSAAAPRAPSSNGSRAPLYSAEESWDDDPPPQQPNPRNPSNYGDPRPSPAGNRNTLDRAPRASNAPAAPRAPSSAGSRTPLYAPSESWDDEPTLPSNSGPSVPSSRPPADQIPGQSARTPSIISNPPPDRSIGSRTPLYAPEESWD